MTTTTPKAAANGSPTAQTKHPAREHGMAKLREEECYHLTGLVRNALNAAERLNEEVHRELSDRYTDFDGRKGTEPLDREHACIRLSEAYDCAAVALTYLWHVTDALRGDVMPPF
jgi:hypothetical protein